MANNQPLYINGSDSFAEQVLQSTQPVLVDFYAEWCGPCKLAAPVMDKLAAEFADQAKIVKIDVDAPENRDLAQRYGVMSIPTVLTFNGGEVVAKNIGFIGESGYRQMITAHLAA